ncbi:MAG: ABC-2 family transporter protein [Spirochaetaceae bacterium]|nr:ABC-2 family transporter protein [Spirochaetaceae bacterium]
MSAATRRLRARLRAVARKYGLIAATGLKSRLAYLANYAGSMLTYGLFVFVFSRIWTAAFLGRAPAEGQGGAATIAGYDRTMAIWYFIVAEISVFGFGRFFWRLADDVKSGQVAYLLARPYSFVGYHWAEAMGPALVDMAVFVAEGILIGLLVAGPPPLLEPARALAVLGSLLLAGSLQFFLQLSIAMTAFWVEENAAFFWIFQKLALVVGTLLPIEFLPDAARAVAVFTPFPSLSYAPARIAVAATGSEALRLVAAQVLWLAGAVALANLVFRAARGKLAVQGG